LLLAISSYRNTSGHGGLGEREIMWNHELTGRVSIAFSSSPNLLRVFL